MSINQKNNDLDFNFLKPNTYKSKSKNKYTSLFIFTFLISLLFFSNNYLSNYRQTSELNAIKSIDTQTNIFINHIFNSEFKFNLLNLNNSINLNNNFLSLNNEKYLLSELALNPLLISLLNKEKNGLHNNVIVKNSIISNHIKIFQKNADKSSNIIVEIKTKQIFTFLDSSLSTQKTFHLKLYFDKYNNYNKFELLN